MFHLIKFHSTPQNTQTNRFLKDAFKSTFKKNKLP